MIKQTFDEIRMALIDLGVNMHERDQVIMAAYNLGLADDMEVQKHKHFTRDVPEKAAPASKAK